jgi:hypothetical protein
MFMDRSYGVCWREVGKVGGAAETRRGKRQARARTFAASGPSHANPFGQENARYTLPGDIIDMTYLRQDFSVLQPVADARPWPEMQRFDFLVRTRQVNAEEAATYRTLFASSDLTQLSPYQQAALTAMREMTGRDAAPTAEAWRKLLELPMKAPRKDKGDISTDGPMTRLR